MPARAAHVTYVDFQMQEWGMGEQSRRMQTSVHRVLGELSEEALVSLKDPRLEVMVLPDSSFSVWAYFPIWKRNQNREVVILPDVQLKPETQILLVLSAVAFDEASAKVLKNCLRDHLGHTLLYLRDPIARNECADAQKEWRRQRSRRLAPKGE